MAGARVDHAGRSADCRDGRDRRGRGDDGMTTKQERDDALRFAPFDEAVAAERAHQRERWGDAHDNGHGPAEWGLIALRYAGRLGDELEGLAVGGASFIDVRTAAI